MKHRERDVLVILRAGDRSLHQAWLEGSSATEREFDLHLSYFGKNVNPFPDRPADVSLSFEAGTKSQGLELCFQKHEAEIAKYKYIWIPDDDIATDCENLNKYFRIVAEYQLEISQPALGAGSYVAHDITLQRPDLKLRYTTFVEIMAPCFSQAVFRRIRPYLGATASSWGVNHMFGHLLGYPENRIAVVDETPVVHTRPFGGPNIRKAKTFGLTPQQEMDRFLAEHGISPRVETFSAIDRSGAGVSADRVGSARRAVARRTPLATRLNLTFDRASKKLARMLRRDPRSSCTGSKIEQ